MTEPVGNKPKISIENIRTGYVMRYFIRHISSRDVLEIDEKQYSVFQSNSLYETFTLKWFILGKEAEHKNLTSIRLYTDFTKNIGKLTPVMMSGLLGLLRSPKEFIITQNT